MKKWIVPIALLLAAASLFVYLRFDSFTGAKVDGARYLEMRAKADSLEREIWQVGDDAVRRSDLSLELAQVWETIENLRDFPGETSVNEEEVLSPESIELIEKWIVPVGIGICALFLLFIIILLRKVFRKRSLNDLDAQKAALSSSGENEPLIIEERFRNPKGGISKEDLTFTRTRASKRPSIIDEANAYAEKNKQSEENEEKVNELPNRTATFAFENSEGIPENRILSSEAGSKKPPLRPTAKQRITTALQSLSSALTRPKGIPRDQTMHLRTQSRNTIDMTVLNKNALDVTRFDKEQADLTTVKKLKSQGFTPGMIAKKMNISQDEAKTLITKVRDAE